MIWLIGNKGMLGSDIEKLLKKKEMGYCASDREVDIIDYKALDKYVKDKEISWIINCAGYTRVDKAEEESEESFRLNRDGVRNLALFCSKRKAKLIHISTDYVFDGRKEQAAGYNEDDKTNPINIYGKSKLAGEEEIKKIAEEYFIIRTAWLYGKEGSNFVYTMLRLFKERDLVNVVEDQWGSPTYTVDLAEVILKIVENDFKRYGIYHFTNEGVTNWYAFAQLIYDKAKRLGILHNNSQVEIKPIKTNEYLTLAKRPGYSVLSQEKIKNAFNLKIRNWEEALEDFLYLLKIKEEKLKGKERKVMKRKLRNILVTGGAGFIGSNFIHYLFKKNSFKGKVINADKLTYAGNLESLKETDAQFGGQRYFFEKVDISDFNTIEKIFQQYDIDTVVNFAAESHVDRSIFGPKDFIQSNIMGTFTLLEAARACWGKIRQEAFLFHHVSTDEVYGSIEEGRYFFEDSAYQPNSPYSASKASSDHLVRAYNKTYQLPVTISNCSNNYGPYQFPEKLIPLIILNILEEKPLPLYGDGKNIRDWLYVEDHCRAIWEIMNKGEVGETYNVGGENEWENIKLVNFLCEKIAKIEGKDRGYYKRLITFVKDRPGHDRRYAINCDKIKSELGWQQEFDFEEGLDMTIQWYMKHQDWVDRIKSG